LIFDVEEISFVEHKNIDAQDHSLPEM